jgi:hypothetical protein
VVADIAKLTVAERRTTPASWPPTTRRTCPATASPQAYLDEHLGARRGHGGVQHVSGQGLLAVGFDHRTSREGDPLVHTHLVVANRVQGPDGRWTALDGRDLYRLWHGRFPLAPTLRAVSFEADRAARVLPDPGLVVVPIVAVHGARVPWGKAVVEGVPVVTARRLPSMLRQLPAVLGPERVAAVASQARIRFRAVA